MIFTTQNHKVSECCPSSRILKSRKYNVSETGSVSVLRWGEGDIFRWVPWKDLTQITGQATSINYSYTNVWHRGKSKDDNRKIVMKHVQTWNVCFFISSLRIRSIKLWELRATPCINTRTQRNMPSKPLSVYIRFSMNCCRSFIT
jgi:hypothetical protein